MLKIDKHVARRMPCIKYCAAHSYHAWAAALRSYSCVSSTSTTTIYPSLQCLTPVQETVEHVMVFGIVFVYKPLGEYETVRRGYSSSVLAL